MGVKSLDPWKRNAHKLFCQIKKYIFEINNRADAIADAFLAQRMGITIQRGNAASTLPHGQHLGDLYIVT